MLLSANQGNVSSQEQSTITSTTVTTTKSSDSPATSKLAEFDFDEGSSQSDLPLFPGSAGGGTVGMGQGAALPLRRVAGSGRHPRPPRVANMDKILNDLFKSRKESSTVHHSQGESGSAVNAVVHNATHELTAPKGNGQCGLNLEPSGVTPTEYQNTLTDNLVSAPVFTTASAETPMDVGDGLVPVVLTATSEALPDQLVPDTPMATESTIDHCANDSAPSDIGNMEHTMSLINSIESGLQPADSVQFTASSVGTVPEPIVSELPEQMARTQLMDKSNPDI